MWRGQTAVGQRSTQNRLDDFSMRPTRLDQTGIKASLVMSGQVWLCQGQFRYVWASLVMSRPVWLYQGELVTSGPHWLMVMPAPVWLCQIMSGQVWLCQGQFGYIRASWLRQGHIG